MFRPSVLAAVASCAAVVLISGPLSAQDVASGRCAKPDTLVLRGNQRVSDGTIRAELGFTPGSTLNARIVQRGVKALYATTQFDDVRVTCEIAPLPGKAAIVVAVTERPLLGEVSVRGTDRVSGKTVRDKMDLVGGQPVDPGKVAAAVARIDSIYQAQGYYLARVHPESTTVGDRMNIVFRIEEGRRLAISGVRVHGNTKLSVADVVGAMQSKPEGFWWWKKGEFDEDKYAGDLGDRLPKTYATAGFVDFQVVRDSLIIDRERGKALIDLTVAEGPQYHVGTFDVSGNKRFSSDEIQRYYPFTNEGPTLTERVTGLIRRRKRQPADVFDRTRWEEATQKIRTAYSNEGYIRADIRPIVERQAGTDSAAPTVNLRWDIAEGSPAIINRIEIQGNDYTTEQCIRNQLVILPGDVFNQDRLIRSYQNIGNLNFFETPIAPPDTRPANDSGDVDIIFKVKEKRTGNINFGASAAATGVGGFIGLQQPNLFGECKQGTLNWQFGGYLNDFNLGYTDPTFRQTQTSMSLSAYRSLNRYITDAGRQIRTGGSLRLGFPVPHSAFSRLSLSYGAEQVTNKGTSGQLLSAYGDGFRSTLGFDASHDTRIDLPFATQGGSQTLSAQFNGGPLGGSAAFQKYTAEFKSYAPLGQFGGGGLGASPIKFVLGLTARAGTVFGNTGPFFFSQQFGLGGVQYGEQLRGYPELCITPGGVKPDSGRSQCVPTAASFGNAFFTSTAEVGVRFNQMIYVNTFYDAGNVWAKARDFNPTRLVRGAGFGASVITPLGPLGLDWAYGFDRVDEQGRVAGKWRLHFRLGQLF